MKLQVFLFASDTGSGTEVEGFNSQAALDAHLLAICADAADNDRKLARLVAKAQKPARKPETRHERIFAAWDYYEEHVKDPLDTYTWDAVWLDFPTVEACVPPLPVAPAHPSRRDADSTSPVIIRVVGGVAEAQSVPAGVTVEIRDYDNGGRMEQPDGFDACGNYSRDVTIGPL